ncbi:MAG: ammonia-forming cytochrome c nitrite reductase [Bacteroidia bacterium]|nr:ammonia-forming cytochrome c nitrite reductase [Bacteroidia bacterium]
MKRRIMDIVQEKPWLGWTLFLGTVVVVFLIGLLGASIMERRGESQLVVQVKPIADWEPRNEVWGENYPRQYERYAETADGSFSSKHGGSAEIDYLEHYPNLVVLWAGYAFSRDYKQGRGHYHAVDDVRNTLRTAVPQPATCWSCKSTDVPRMMNQKGVAEFYKDTWANMGPEIVNNIGCQDCHDPKSMNLRITRPALIEAFQRQGKDISKATHQEMRSLVCAQCHVEYYFKGKEEKYLTFPWDKGFSAEEMEAYYDEIEHVDFVHKLSRAPIIKAQHPDYELYMTGIHAKRGVSCADCHMPYRSEGGVKFTDHKIQSPLANIANSCQVCHRESEQNLLRDVYERQDKMEEMRKLAEDALAKAHIEAKFAWDKGATESEMAPVLKLIRQAQWRWDWVAAANGLGFHSPVEASRTMANAIQKAEAARAQIVRVLAKRGYTDAIPLPDISTKAKAQAFIGLDMAVLNTEKQDFLSKIIPEWDAAAKARQAKY